MKSARYRSFIRSTLYDPIKTRIIYDAFAAFGAFVCLWLVLSLFAQEVPSFVYSLVFTFIFVLSCAGFGLYSRFRLAHIVVKVTAIFCALIATSIILRILGVQNFFLSLVFIVTFLSTSIPRMAFALTLGRSGQRYFGKVDQTHLPVLVVGGGGYIGSHVVEQLLAEGYGVRVFDTFQYGRKVLDDLTRTHRNLELIEGDVSDMYKLTLAMQGVRAVVHLAGIVGDPACAVDPELTRHVNIISTRLLRESAKAFGVGKFVFASSCSVYGSSDKQVSEASDLHPVSLYAQTKIDSEQELLTDTHDAFHPVVLRFATVFGHSRKPRFDLVANLFTAQAYCDGRILLSGKDQWRPFVHVSDVARAVVMVIKAPESLVSRQIFNVGDDDLNARIGDLANMVRESVGISKKKKKVIIKELDFKGDRRNYNVSFAKITKVLGFRSQISIAQGVDEMVSNWKKGKYGLVYTDPYYSNLESAKELKTAFHTGKYQATHVSILSEVTKMDNFRKRKL